jgi:hypothetical protein
MHGREEKLTAFWRESPRKDFFEDCGIDVRVKLNGP